jgi:hypothetical protein
MENLINTNIRLQNNGLSELECWTSMLKKAQLKLLSAYTKKDVELTDKVSKEIDFIQKQVIRLTNSQS